MGWFSFKKKNEKRTVTWSADSPNGYYNFSAIGAETVNKIIVTEEKALQLTTVLACIRVVSQDFASMPFTIRYKTENGDSFIAKNSIAHQLLKEPNEYMTRFDFFSTMVACRMLHGNGYAEIIRNQNDLPTKLIPINSVRVVPKVEDNILFYEIDGKHRIESKNMLHFKGVSTDGLVGISVIKSESQNIGLSLAAQVELKKFYEKGSKLDGFISYPNKLDTNVKDKTETGLIGKYSGTEGKRLGVLDNGATFVKVGINPSDALWLELMGYGVKEICRMFGVPPHLVQELEKSTNNNIEHQSIDYVNHCLLPIARCFEEEIQRKLLLTNEKKNDYYAHFNMNGLLRGDMLARAEFYKTLDNSGAISANQIRRLEDMNGYEGGDTYFRQLNQMDATKITEYHINAEGANNKGQEKPKRRNSDILEDILNGKEIY